ncbi:MAG: 50S ribosomal protein L18 [Nitrospirota bacterium]|nr:50S ribosomal protein L18 [Nitrospirota bacterium]
MALSKDQSRQRRHKRIRKRVNGTGTKPRLSVYKSLNHIYVQLIDDMAGKTILSASTLEKEIGAAVKHGGNLDAAKKVGASIAKKALSKQITDVIFDRGGYKYHGCIKALADAAREQGLKF